MANLWTIDINSIYLAEVYQYPMLLEPICRLYNHLKTSGCVVCKILEHIIHSSVMEHLDKYDIITDKQHGFRHRRSCKTQLIATIEGIANKIQRGKDQVDIIFPTLLKLLTASTSQTELLRYPWLNSYLDQRIPY